jgi:hypothetical protein
VFHQNSTFLDETLLGLQSLYEKTVRSRRASVSSTLGEHPPRTSVPVLVQRQKWRCLVPLTVKKKALNSTLWHCIFQKTHNNRGTGPRYRSIPNPAIPSPCLDGFFPKTPQVGVSSKIETGIAAAGTKRMNSDLVRTFEEFPAWPHLLGGCHSASEHSANPEIHAFKRGLPVINKLPGRALWRPICNRPMRACTARDFHSFESLTF